MELNKEFDIESFYERVGFNVAKYRKEADLSQLKLAMLMGLNSVSVVASAETYRKSGKHFNLEHIYKISEILEIDIGLLLR
jgi:transcriptional regulator with XRE-family HTH domain